MVNISNQTFNQTIYVLQNTSGTQYQRVNNIVELRESLLVWLEIRKSNDFMGWSPEEYTEDALREFNQRFSMKAERINKCSPIELLKLIAKYHITLTKVDPDCLTPGDFANDENHIFIEPDDLYGNFETIQ